MALCYISFYFSALRLAMQIKNDSANELLCQIATVDADEGSPQLNMLSTPTFSLLIQTSRGGGRIASDRYRQSLDLCDDFTGLEENTNRYDLLLLVKRAGKLAGFTPRMIMLLDYYMAFTRELDWEEGSRPIVYQSLARTSLDLGVSERQIQKLEQQLFATGAITWNDSGNHRRYGQRHSATGKIVYAYGVDLTPLAYLRSELEDKLHQKQLYAEAWQKTKRHISSYRRQIRSLMLEWQEEGTSPQLLQKFEQDYQEIAIQLRTHIELQELRTLLGRHKRLHSALVDAMGVGGGRKKEETACVSSAADRTQKSSCRSVPKFVHYKYSTQLKNSGSPSASCFQKSVAKPTEPDDLVSATGLQHVSLGQVLQVASEHFWGYLPLASRPMEWNDVVEAAYRLRSELHISQQSWGEACDVLGRVGASLCVLITDQGTQRAENRVTQPAAYFRGMVNRARAGELRLHSSVFGLLERDCVNEHA